LATNRSQPNDNWNLEMRNKIPLHRIAAELFGTSNVPLLRRAVAGTAGDLRRAWDYRSLGLSAAQARKRLSTALAPYPPQSRRPPEQPACISQSIVAYKRDRLRWPERLQTLANLPTARTLAEAGRLLSGWPLTINSCIVPCRRGSLWLRRVEDVTWQDNHHWPDKKVTYEAIWVASNGRLLATVKFSRRGNWLSRLAAEVGTEIDTDEF
jgi:hypothetical protein